VATYTLYYCVVLYQSDSATDSTLHRYGADADWGLLDGSTFAQRGGYDWSVRVWRQWSLMSDYISCDHEWVQLDWQVIVSLTMTTYAQRGRGQGHIILVMSAFGNSTRLRRSYNTRLYTDNKMVPLPVTFKTIQVFKQKMDRQTEWLTTCNVNIYCWHPKRNIRRHHKLKYATISKPNHVVRK